MPTDNDTAQNTTIASLETEITEIKRQQEQDAKDAAAEELTRELETERREREAERLEHELKLSELRSSKFVEDAKQKVSSERDVNIDIQRKRIIGQIGNARWHNKSAAERLTALGIEDSETVSDAKLSELFGPTSSSLKATQLIRSNPVQYHRLKAIYLERTSGKR
jgi:hypothetical protein